MNYQWDRDRDTICAVSTPAGTGGVSIIRVSGPQAIVLTKKIAPFLPDKTESHRIYFGSLISLANLPIDEVLVSIFHQGKSFTGEETTEISCHGSPSICEWILQELISCGCRTADRGEFSFRSFMNGRLDLIQAEGVLQLVQSQSRQAAKQGLRQLKGELSKVISKIESDLIYVMANIEAAIDFSTENLEVINRKEMISKLEDINHRIQNLLQTYQQGRWMVEGLRVVFSGAPNVGKSSFFNLLLQEERAIVTSVPGTTRDVVDSTLILDGVRVLLSDTAGIRESNQQELDLAEKIGITRSLESQKDADINLYLFDASSGLSDDDFNNLFKIDQSGLFLLGNKLDKSSLSTLQLKEKVSLQLAQRKFFKNEQELADFIDHRVLFTSTLEHKYRDQVFTLLKEFLKSSQLEDITVISQARHFDNLNRAGVHVEQARLAFEQQAENEFIALDLKASLIAVQEILGKRFDDQVMDQVFRQFCIGK